MTAQASRYDLVLKGGHLVDERNGIDGVTDIAIKAGKVAAVGKDLDPAGAPVRDVSGCYVSPGLIDIHTHVYHKATSLGVDPDMIGRRSAVTTMVDAGSAGAGNYDGLRDYVMKHSPYNILAFLNVSFPGIFGFDKDVQIGEATLAEMLPVHRCVRKIEENRDKIVGVKVRIGGPVTGKFGLGALELALEAANQVDLPLMTHIGGPPPSYADVVSMLRPGDILTHCFRPAPNSAITENGQILPEILEARERGVLFDIAHGMGAFGYESTEVALRHDFKPDVISSDVHIVAVEGPAFDMLHTMSKLLNCGLTVAETLARSSNRPALAIQRPELGHLGVGAVADITVLRVDEARYTFSDVRGIQREGDKLFHPMAVYMAGRESEIARRPFEEDAFVMQHCPCGTHG